MRNRARARRIKMILMDVDGTLTDGTLAVLPDGDEIKAYNVKDGLGVLLAQLIDLKLGIITGKRSQGLVRRAERLKIAELHHGVIDKKPVFDDILKRHGLAPEEAAYIGDDIGDLEVMAAAGLAAAVADAHKLVKKQATTSASSPAAGGPSGSSSISSSTPRGRATSSRPGSNASSIEKSDRRQGRFSWRSTRTFSANTTSGGSSTRT